MNTIKPDTNPEAWWLHGREDAERAARDLAAAFDWGTTPEGYAYWRILYETLLRLSRGETPIKDDPSDD